MYRIHD